MESTDSNTPKVIVLTGASSGIGEATTRHLAQMGHQLVIGARRTDRLTALQDELRAQGAGVDALTLDVTRLDDVQRIAAFAQQRYGRIDVLINNAGIMPLSPLAALKVDEWNRMIELPLKFRLPAGRV
ncbi:NADP-dependent 3-hydroxy acid dehydrogenase YdfG [Paraburkholderia sp. JPY158]|uniref:NADP-dependent 3-hydroxy acid dehydrogenase YdfG n=1 Tax=Paraburkholderia atlantica TaxID=2654982 RepID=A0A7W8V7S9_PARAM|nr:SDR family NAD(P)-dependent oxidoreductase [Paraburkholderia atlantica]MBB5426099.1 NADP-dependent 3-hydroxy acid dehydrogenase YdfG [Paraburkholderia atlantica]